MKKWLGSGMLLLAAIIWGVAFVAQSVGMDYVEPYTFNFARYMIGGTVLLPFVLLKGKKPVAEEVANEQVQMNTKVDKTSKLRKSILGGIGCGCFLFIASILQQFGILYTDVVGKAGFITALYIILVPVLGLFLHKKTKPLLWVCVVISVVGLYLLCMSEGYYIEKADIFLLLCALFFAFHILLIDYIAPFTDGVVVACVQFFTAGVCCMAAMFFFETPSIQGILEAYIPILYTGVLSCGVAYTFQILGQKYLEPTKASLILCLESVVSVLAAWLILKQELSFRELLGCVIMFVAIILAQFVQKEPES